MRPGVVCKLRFEAGSILPGRGPWNLRMIGPRGPIILVLLDPGSRSRGVQSYCDNGYGTIEGAQKVPSSSTKITKKGSLY